MENILSIVVENKIFFLFGGLILILNLVSYFIYNVLKIDVIFPEEKLIESEKVLINSFLRKMITSGGLRFSIRKNYIVITNKRVILAANFFGFWTYKFSKSFWLGKDFTNARLGKKSNFILFNWENKNVEIFVENPSEILEKIDK